MESITILDVAIRLFIAVILGGSLGFERTLVGRNAGLKTYSLVSLGSALFVVIALQASRQFIGFSGYNPLLVAAQIVAGVGFLGAGLIIFQQSKVQGLTTAAGLWVAAGLGMASGFGFYLEAAIATLLALLIFTVLWMVEEKIKKYAVEDNNEGRG